MAVHIGFLFLRARVKEFLVPIVSHYGHAAITRNAPAIGVRDSKRWAARSQMSSLVLVASDLNGPFVLEIRILGWSGINE